MNDSPFQETLKKETYSLGEITEAQRIRNTMLLCEVAIGEVGAAEMTPASAHALEACYQWLQEVHTNIQDALNDALAKEKADESKKGPAPVPGVAES